MGNFSGRLAFKLKPQKCKWMKVNIMNNERLRARDSMVKDATLDIKKRIALA